ncbi:MAG: hypothetical protein KAS04_03105, partial [Candidatus Aenigmarchaeota archaeon]|nr:hypothetical protein [Candidatus Aenigmarchaeota archaeon]
IQYVNIPKGIKPRFALGYLLLPMIVILEKLKFIEKQNLDLLIKNLIDTREEIGIQSPYKNNSAKKIAAELVDTIPIVQGFGAYEPIAYRAITQFNENSKIPSFSENYPELNHNSILGWWGAGSIGKYMTVLIIRDDNETESIRKRIEFTKKVMEKTSKLLIEIWSEYPYGLSRALSTMYVLDFISVYLGILRNKDPGDDSIISKMKTILSGQ